MSKKDVKFEKLLFKGINKSVSTLKCVECSID